MKGGGTEGGRKLIKREDERRRKKELMEKRGRISGYPRLGKVKVKMGCKNEKVRDEETRENGRPREETVYKGKGEGA